MNPKDQAPPSSRPFTPPTALPGKTLHEVNARCIELLVYAARQERYASVPLVRHLRDVLRHATPETRRRAAQRQFLLVNLEFQDGQWWRGVQQEPTKRWLTPGWHQAFPRRTAVPLARATLTMAWVSLHEEPESAPLILGMSKDVARVIASLRLCDIDRIAERRFRHVLPRWHDQPDFWRELFEAAEAGTPAALRHCNLRGLQMMCGECLRCDP